MATLTAKQAPSTAVGDGSAAGAAAAVLRMLLSMVSGCERDHAASGVLRTLSSERRAMCGRCGARSVTATSAWHAATLSTSRSHSMSTRLQLRRAVVALREGGNSSGRY